MYNHLDEDLREVAQRGDNAVTIFKQRKESYKPNPETIVEDKTANIILSLLIGLLNSVQKRRNKSE